MKIVFNSSPLIFLSRLNYLDYFLLENHHFYLPKSVKIEIRAKQDSVTDNIESLINNQKLMVKEIKLISLANRLYERLGKGESDAIVLGLELQTDYVILDDFTARKEAIKLGLNVKGTLAIIRKLLREKKIIINDFESFYQKISKMNFRVKREIFDSIFNN